MASPDSFVDSPANIGRAEAPDPLPADAIETAWMSPELIAGTREVWSQYLGRQVSRAEAMEILINVQGLAMAYHLAQADGEVVR